MTLWEVSSLNRPRRGGRRVPVRRLIARSGVASESIMRVTCGLFDSEGGRGLTALKIVSIDDCA